MIKFLSYVIILVAVSQISPILTEPHPSYKKCLMQDSDCLIREAQQLLKQFVNGIPEYHVDKLDEMFIDSLEIKADGINQELQNIKISGLGNAKINDISFDNNFKLIRISFDATLKVIADYTLKGIFFWQPISGEGTTTYIARDIQTDLMILYDINENDNGKHRLKLKRYRTGFTIKDRVEYQYENLFNGDKEKSDVAHALLNKNWVIITNVFGSDFYSKIAGNVFDALKEFARSQDLEDLFLYQ